MPEKLKIIIKKTTGIHMEETGPEHIANYFFISLFFAANLMIYAHPVKMKCFMFLQKKRDVYFLLRNKYLYCLKERIR